MAFLGGAAVSYERGTPVMVDRSALVCPVDQRMEVLTVRGDVVTVVASATTRPRAVTTAVSGSWFPGDKLLHPWLRKEDADRHMPEFAPEGALGSRVLRW